MIHRNDFIRDFLILNIIEFIIIREQRDRKHFSNLKLVSEDKKKFKNNFNNDVK